MPIIRTEIWQSQFLSEVSWFPLHLHILGKNSYTCANMVIKKTQSQGEK